MTTLPNFNEAYKKLNKAQKEAVDAIDGPVMVVAGPGTGKTQVLALRIANILQETDTPADGILCLTFTNAGVEAMHKRLISLVGEAGAKVKIKTFHGFGIELLEEFYEVLGYHRPPKLLDDVTAISLADEILESNSWKHIRTRGNASEHFSDLKSLISMLKRDAIKPEEFLMEIEKDIKNFESDPDNISSRGPTKGEIKKEIQNKIEGLERTKEVVEFYRLYEEKKKEEELVDYDDILSRALDIVIESTDARATLLERYLYVHVDEHQDSSRVQNAFLEALWSEVEKPNIFVVGDDRQLIYGFSGASLSHFDNFKNVFGKVKVITLTENYRSTQHILDTADSMLDSKLADGKLNSNIDRHHDLELHEADYARDEIIRAGEWFKERIEKDGISAESCALLVPKNAQVRSAVTVLRDMGLPVESSLGSRLFDQNEYRFMITLLYFIQNPNNSTTLVDLLLNPLSGIRPFALHTFLAETNPKKLKIQELLSNKDEGSLFAGVDPIAQFSESLKKLLDDSSKFGIYALVQEAGRIFILEKTQSHEALVRGAETVRTMLEIILARLDIHPTLTLPETLEFFKRLEEYRHAFPVATIDGGKGIQVLTLHGSKGLEFEAVWIAHLDEKSIMGSRRAAFTLPEMIKERIVKKDEEAARRELYVAITRAKYWCSLSFSTTNHTGGITELAEVVRSIPKKFFTEYSRADTEKFLLDHGGPKIFIGTPHSETEGDKEKMLSNVSEIFPKAKVSVTLLNNFFECPWKWYFRNLLAVPEGESASLVFGSIVHEAFEALLKDELIEKNIKKFIEQEFENDVLLDEPTKKRLLPEAIAVVSNWTKSDLPQILSDHRSEQSLSTKDARFPEITITGKIDLQERLGEGDIRVTDFKTGKSKTKNVIEKITDEGRMSSYLRQLAMYSYLIDKTTKGDTRVVESVLSFIEENGKDRRYSTRVGAQETDLLTQDISDYVELVKSGKWTERPCDFKPWGNKTECEYCKRAEAIFSFSKA